MIETTIREVNCSEEENTINFMTCFGWTLQSNHNNYGGTVKLTFTRDIDRPNRDRLQELENEYRAKQALVLCNAMLKPEFNFGLAVGLYFLFVFPLVLYVIHYRKLVKKWEQEQQQYEDDFNNNKDRILKEAVSLL